MKTEIVLTPAIYIVLHVKRIFKRYTIIENIGLKKNIIENNTYFVGGAL